MTERRTHRKNSALPQRTGAGSGSVMAGRYAKDEGEALWAIRSEKARLAAKRKADLAAASKVPITLPKIGWGEF